MDRSLLLNRASWDERAPLHAASRDYEVEVLVSQPEHLSETVRFDVPRLGDVRGLRTVHLQCHIGTDTVSLARLGAQVCGLDYSAASLLEARRLAERCGAAIEYFEADVYQAERVLPISTFDLVYMGIGALCWLPRIEPWARTVAALLKPGGRLFLRDGHPMLMAVNEDHRDRLQLEYTYFEQESPTVWHTDQTYVESDQRLLQIETHEWNHGLGEVISSFAGQWVATFLAGRAPEHSLGGPARADGQGGRWRVALASVSRTATPELHLAGDQGLIRTGSHRPH